MLVFDLEKVSRVKNKKGYEREIISLFKDENGVPHVKYRVKVHADKFRIDKVSTVKRKSFVNWLKGIQINKDEFKVGDILEFGDFTLHVLSNKGIWGSVRDYHKGYVIEKFYWRGYSDMRCYKIGWENPFPQN